MLFFTGSACSTKGFYVSTLILSPYKAVTLNTQQTKVSDG